ncbi:MAG: S-adenosylmethionine synthetase N-terminal domain-containing protein, partial [Cyanobacteriota bacterium]
MSRRYLFTSESVTEGHPDKICDQISDSILDALLTQDPNSRVAAEVVVNTGLVLITGEISSKGTVNYVDLVRQKIAEIG